jgi:hypothetical protein
MCISVTIFSYFPFFLLSGIDTGAVLVDRGKVILDEVSFSSNSISKSTSFPNLRHNVFVSSGGIVNVTSIAVDTAPSNFIYISDDGGGSVVYGLDV